MSTFSEKAQKLRERGFNLGAALDATEQNTVGGGLFQRFTHATIYWHPVMGAEAHEVHGGILGRYMKMGGPAVNPATGRRDLGFPLSDETETRVGRFAVSYFEFGALLWKHGAGAIYGDFYKEWIRQGAETGPLGYPISEEIAVAGGQAIFFEFACLFRGPVSGNQMLQFDYAFPRPGSPDFVSLTGAKLTVSLHGGGTTEGALKSLPTTLFQDRFFLSPTGRPFANPIGLSFSTGLPVSVGTMAPGQVLTDRTLYDVVFKLAPGDFPAVAPHAIYAKISWQSFGAMHATDIHVSTRLDGFKAKLSNAGRGEGAAAFNNYNDNFRDLIRYANRLHANGQLDVILATGDLVDYQFEEGDWRGPGDHAQHGGNFAYFLKFLLGQAPSPDGGKHEELRVPLLTTLGNHDYRGFRYLLNFDVSVTGADDPTIRNFAPMNLMDKEADAIQGGFKTVSQDAAINMAKIDASLDFYHRRVGTNNVVKQLGDHRIVMLDTRWDNDMVDTKWEALQIALGVGTSESQRNFADGNPDSIGVSDEGRRLLKQALAENPAGVVLVGMHAPPLNPAGNEFPHYFRATEHSSLERVGEAVQTGLGFNNVVARDEIAGFLLRHDPAGWSSYSGWRNTKGKDYFAKGQVGHLLDFGSAQRNEEEFLQICAGVGVPRKVDAVLFGHGHYRADFHVGWDDAKKQFEFYFDFFTENPAEYYNSRKLGFTDPVGIRLRLGAPLNGKPGDIDTAWGKAKSLDVVPYQAPLSLATDKRQWWETHRPLLLQTGAVGPMEANQRRETVAGKKRSYPGPSFMGRRVIEVNGNVIQRIKYTTMTEIRQALTATMAGAKGLAAGALSK